jgi:hypothetical protein
LGQTAAIACAHVGQKVHSYVQMYASSAGASAAPHRSHTFRISNAIEDLRVLSDTLQDAAPRLGAACHQLAA